MLEKLTRLRARTRNKMLRAKKLLPNARTQEIYGSGTWIFFCFGYGGMLWITFLRIKVLIKEVNFQFRKGTTRTICHLLQLQLEAPFKKTVSV